MTEKTTVQSYKSLLIHFILSENLNFSVSIDVNHFSSNKINQMLATEALENMRKKLTVPLYRGGVGKYNLQRTAREH